MGNIILELYWRHAPNTCRNFAELVRRGYYSGVKFHRIIKDFMIQGGDPTGTGDYIFVHPSFVCQSTLEYSYSFEATGSVLNSKKRFFSGNHRN